MKRAAFLDRDGVLNWDDGYVHTSQQFRWIQHAREAIALLRAAGYLAIVVTNQSGIARGYYQESSLHALFDHMLDELAQAGTTLDGWYYCPHLPDGAVMQYRRDCACRKPKPGMLLQAAREHSLDLSASLLIGDRESDLAAARAAGARGHLFPGGDLLAFTHQVLRAERVDDGGRAT